MEITYLFLQHYWWAVISLLASLLVFLLFVQGGQSLLYTIGRTGEERSLIATTLGRKWEFTFTTLVVFGGTFFASFPLFYSTSFGGAFYVWTLILLVFVVQAVSYEYRRKPRNFLGERTYNAFLIVNGVAGTFLLGAAVATLFTGAPFTVDRLNLANTATSASISQWATPWRGLDALADYRCWALGLAVLFLSRTLGLQYFLNSIADEPLVRRSQARLLRNAVPFVFFFLVFLISLLLGPGAAVTSGGTIAMEPYKYLHNLLDMPAVLVILATGVVLVLAGIVLGACRGCRKSIWYSGTGTILTVFALMLLAGWNHTAYYPSTADLQSSLTIYNSSSSEFTLRTMGWISLFVPVIAAYIWYAWRAMNRRPVTRSEMADKDAQVY